MQDRVASLHRGTHAVRIADVAGKYVELFADFGRRRIEPAVRAHAVVMHERPYVEIPADQFFRKVRPDKSAGAREQYFLQGSRILYRAQHPGVAWSLLNRSASGGQIE